MIFRSEIGATASLWFPKCRRCQTVAPCVGGQFLFSLSSNMAESHQGRRKMHELCKHCKCLQHQLLHSMHEVQVEAPAKSEYVQDWRGALVHGDYHCAQSARYRRMQRHQRTPMTMLCRRYARFHSRQACNVRASFVNKRRQSHGPYGKSISPDPRRSQITPLDLFRDQLRSRHRSRFPASGI